MRTIKIIIEYDGTDFNGWQAQPTGFRTVQGEIEGALQRIFKTKTTLIGSGRTDSGVHAAGQVAHFRTSSAMPAQTICAALNGNLPGDIAILNATDVENTFHAQYSAERKTYRYRILNRKTRGALNRHVCFLYPFPLNVRRMQQEAKALIGTHDFKSFKAADSDRREKNTVRTITRLDIKKREDEIIIDIEANGFLYKMVRNIVGTLLDIGNGRLPKGSMQEILEKKDRTLASPTAAPNGLTLLNVTYPPTKIKNHPK